MCQGGLIIEVSRSHPDTQHSVGPLWMRDRPVAETSTWQHTTFTSHRERHQCPRRDSDRQSSKRAAADPCLRPRSHCNRPTVGLPAQNRQFPEQHRETRYTYMRKNTAILFLYKEGMYGNYLTITHVQLCLWCIRLDNTPRENFKFLTPTLFSCIFLKGKKLVFTVPITGDKYSRTSHNRMI
jgi:hypothetical protein